MIADAAIAAASISANLPRSVVAAPPRASRIAFTMGAEPDQKLSNPLSRFTASSFRGWRIRQYRPLEVTVNGQVDACRVEDMLIDLVPGIDQQVNRVLDALSCAADSAFCEIDDEMEDAGVFTRFAATPQPFTLLAPCVGDIVGLAAVRAGEEDIAA